MHRTIIADTSCFIVLTNIGELHLLYAVYGQILTTTDIADEFGEQLPDWVTVEVVHDKYRQKVLEMQVDRGEASAIALALELQDSTLIIDDYKARKVAKQLGVSFTGTLGVIIKAKLTGKIQSIKPLLYKIRETDFRVSEEVERQALRQAGE